MIFALLVVCAAKSGHFAAAEVDAHKPIEKEEENIIKHWIDVIEDTRADVTASKCSADYLNQLENQFEQDKRVSQVDRVDELFVQAEVSVLSNCGAKVLEQVEDELDFRRLQKGMLLEMVGTEYNKWFHQTDDPSESFRYMAEWMLWVVGVDKRRGDSKSFIDAWKRGPCETVLHKLDEPAMKPVANFVQMLDRTSIDPFELDTAVPTHVSMVQSCEHLQSLPVLVDVWNALQQRDAVVEERVQFKARLL